MLSDNPLINECIKIEIAHRYARYAMSWKQYLIMFAEGWEMLEKSISYLEESISYDENA